MLKAEVLLAGSKKTTKALAAGALMAGMMAASLMTASPAHASTTFVVNDAGDGADASSTDGSCKTSSGVCTLRAAMQQANATSGADSIDFDIPGKGVHTISPNSPLPEIDEAVTINGYSQPGSSVNTLTKGTNAKLLIELDGTNSSGGLNVEASDVVIRGLAINRFTRDIVIEIAPDTPDEAVGNARIEGNFIGTDPSGTIDQGNRAGVDMFNSSNNTVGGDSPAARNILSGNDFAGVFIEGESSFFGGPSDNNKVKGNLIGLGKDGVTALGNGSGPDIPGVGVLGDAAKGNSILSNSIFASSRLGIDLGDNGPTANDGDDPNTPQLDPDADTGPNQLQNKPEVTSAKPTTKRVKGKKKRFTSISGTLNSNASKTFTIQLFSNPPGTTDEGKTLIGQKSVKTDASGNASFDLAVSRSKAPVGSAITATATNEATGDTSEFSIAKQVG